MVTTLKAIAVGAMAILCLAVPALAQATGDYRSSTTGNWATASTWERYNGASWVAAGATPTSADGAITVRSGHTVTIAADVTADQIVVESGAELIISGNNVNLSLANGAGTDLDVSGILRQQNSADPIVIAASATIVFENGGVYEHALNGGTVPTATWSTGSTLRMIGPATTGTEPTGLGQSFYNVVWAMTGSANRTPISLVTINGDFIVNSISGSLLKLSQGFATSRTLTIGGDFIVNLTSGTLDLSAGGADLVVEVAGDYIQNGTGGTVDLNDNGQSANGTLKVAGDFSVLNGTTTATGPSLLMFNGAANQNIRVDGTFSGPINVNVAKPGGSLYLLTNFTVDGRATMTMTQGNIFTDTWTWTLGTSTSQVGTLSWTDGTIIGYFRRWFDAATVSGVLFPVGTAAFHRPAVVSYTTAPLTGGTVTARFVPIDPGDAGTPISDGTFSIHNVASEGYWEMPSGNGLNGGAFSLSITGTGFGGITDVLDLRVVRRNDDVSPWSVQGAHVAGSGTIAAPTANRSVVSTFGEFGIGSAGDSPLPIELADFQLSSANGQVLVAWRTASEIENAGFEVQRAASSEGEFRSIVSWRTDPRLAGLGTSPVGRSYSFLDDGNFGTLVTGETYRYRLVDVAYDGTRTVHASASVRIAGLSTTAALDDIRLGRAVPNPAVDATSMALILTEAMPVTTEIISADGRLMSSNSISYGPGALDLKIDTRELQAGVYTLRLVAPAGVRVQRFVVVR